MFSEEQHKKERHDGDRLADLLDRQVDVLFDRADREVQRPGDLGIGHVAVVAHGEYLAPLVGHRTHHRVDEPDPFAHVHVVVNVRIAVGDVEHRIVDVAAQHVVPQPHVVEKFVARGDQQVIAHRQFGIDLLLAHPHFDEDVLDDVLRHGRVLDDMPGEGVQQVVVAVEKHSEGCLVAAAHHHDKLRIP